MKKLSIILFIGWLSIASLMSQANLPGVIIERPQTKAQWHTFNLDKHLYNIMLEAAVNQSAIYHVIDESNLELMTQVRAEAVKNFSDLPSAQMIGASYVMESKVLDYKETTKKYYKQIKQDDGSYKDGACDKRGMDVTIKLNMNLVSVETSEVVSSREFVVSGFATRDCNKFKVEEDKVRKECIADFRSCMELLFKKNMMDLLQAKLKVEGMLKTKKESAKELIIKSGPFGNVGAGVNLKVISMSAQDVDGVEVVREKQIGEAEIVSVRYGSSYLKVKKGGKEIYQSMSNNENLYVVYDKNYRYVDCSGKGAPKKRRELKRRLEGYDK